MGPDVNTGKKQTKYSQSSGDTALIRPSRVSMTTCTALNVRYEMPAKPSRFWCPNSPPALQQTSGARVSASANRYSGTDFSPCAKVRRATNSARPAAARNSANAANSAGEPENRNARNTTLASMP